MLAAENKLHPALFSSKAEHKVLQHLMNGLMSVTFKSEDLQCSYFRYTVRELLACVVMRPVLNLANPRFINERIETVVINETKTGDTSESEPKLAVIDSDTDKDTDIDTDTDGKMLILGIQGDRSHAPVTSRSLNQQGDLLLAGYGDGHVTLWNGTKKLEPEAKPANSASSSSIPVPSVD